MFLFILFSSLLLSLSSFAQIPTIKISNSDTFYIIDGDSVSLKMRINGIDAPEKLQKCYKNKNQIINCGLVAKEYLQILLKNIQGEIIIKPISIDYYNRILVNIYKNEVNIGKRMVADGMAFAYDNQYMQQEQQAKKLKKGFWGYFTQPLNPKVWRKKNGNKF